MFGKKEAKTMDKNYTSYVSNSSNFSNFLQVDEATFILSL